MNAKPPIEKWRLDLALRRALSPVKKITPTAMVIEELVEEIRFGSSPPDEAWQKLRSILDARVESGDHASAFDAFSNAWKRKRDMATLIIDGRRFKSPKGSLRRRRQQEVIDAIDTIQEKEGRAPSADEIAHALRHTGMTRDLLLPHLDELGWRDLLSTRSGI